MLKSCCSLDCEAIRPTIKSVLFKRELFAWLDGGTKKCLTHSTTHTRTTAEHSKENALSGIDDTEK